MGTKLAPAYANIFMSELEKSFIQYAPINHSFGGGFYDFDL